jgi:hypothetical protein
LHKLKSIKSDNKTQWTTSAGTFETKHKAQAQMIFIELHETRTITCEAHIAPDLGANDMTVGRELQIEIGVLLNFKDETIERDEDVIPMKPETAKVEKHFHIVDSSQVDDATERIKRILNAKYEPADLQKIVTDRTHLSPDEQQALHTLLNN